MKNLLPKKTFSKKLQRFEIRIRFLSKSPPPPPSNTKLPSQLWLELANRCPSHFSSLCLSNFIRIRFLSIFIRHKYRELLEKRIISEKEEEKLNGLEFV